MTDFFDESVFSIPARIGAVPDLADPTRGHLPLGPDIVHAGAPRAAALMMLADTVVGMRLETEMPEWTFTTDFSIRLTAAPTSGVVTGESATLRSGRRLIVERFEYTDESGEPVGHAQITFMRTPLRGDEVKVDVEAIRERMAALKRPALDAPLAEAAGIETLDPAAGCLRLAPHDLLRRPGGFVQGSIMTLIGEVAATTLAEHHHGAPCAVVDLDVRYLIGGRAGPLESRARWLGDPLDGRVAVELIDTGHDDVITSTFLARVAPAR